MAEKLLSISLLVSGREDTTEKCLESLRDLKTGLDAELILVDTGCKEPLREKLKEYADQIVEFTWCNDFAKARNAGLKLAKGEWFLFLDDDEWFEDVTPILTFFQSGEYKNYHQAVYKARNYSKLDGSAYTDEWVSRMIYLEEDTHFEGRVHESLVPARGKCKQIDAFVHHYGYAFTSEEERLAHKKRNVDILKQLIIEEPDNMKWRLQMIQEYAQESTAEEMRKEACSAIELVKDADKPFVNQCRGAFYTAVLIADLWQKKSGQCRVDALDFLKDERNTPRNLCSIHKYYVDALLCEQRGLSKDEDSEQWMALQNEIAEGCKAFLENYEKERLAEYDEQERIIAESILFVKDCMNDREYHSMELKWVCALAVLARQDEIPASVVEGFTQKLREQLKDDGEFLMLDENAWTLAKAKVLPLEDMILELPFSQWVVQVLVLKSRKSEALWDEMRLHLMDIQTREDIRYDYFHTQAVNDIILNHTSDKSYEDLCIYLQEFASCNLKYADWVYTEKAMSGDMDMVEENCRAAIWIARMFECEENDWSNRLDCLKNCALVWPAMGDLAKQFANLIGEEQTKQSTQAAMAQSELDDMAKTVKKQVATLLDAGMIDEALAVIQQLRQILPQDGDLIAWETKLRKQNK